MITQPQAALARALVRAFLELEFRAAVVEDGHGGPRVEVRHKNARCSPGSDAFLLVAIIALQQPPGAAPRPQVVYAVQPYRAGVDRAVRNVLRGLR